MNVRILPSRISVRIRSLVIACIFWVVPLLFSSQSAQTSSVPYDQSYGPLFHLRSSSYVYPRSYRSIHDVDFENLIVTFRSDKNGRPMLIQLRNGKWEVKSHLGQNSIRLGGLHFLGSAEPGRECALTVYEEDDVGGSSSEYGIAEVFELADKRLRVAQLIDWDLRYGGPEGPLDDFDEKADTLTIRTPHYRPGDHYKEASAVDIVTYRWDGRAFGQTAIQTELLNNGRLKPKASPPKSIPVHMP